MGRASIARLGNKDNGRRNMRVICSLLPPSSSSTAKCVTLKPNPSLHTLASGLSNPRPILFTGILSFALTVTLNSPLSSLAIPSPNSLSPLASPTTPFSESKNLQTGLENGKIRPCPSINPGCVSTNAKSSSFAFPMRIPENSTTNPVQTLQDAILKTQRNAEIKVTEVTPYGQYLQAEVDGGFGRRDVLEFLVRGDVVTYRCMATKVTYVYPFTTAFGDSTGQEERLKKIIDQLGWYAPSFASMD